MEGEAKILNTFLIYLLSMAVISLIACSKDTSNENQKQLTSLSGYSDEVCLQEAKSLASNQNIIQTNIIVGVDSSIASSSEQFISEYSLNVESRSSSHYVLLVEEIDFFNVFCALKSSKQFNYVEFNSVATPG